MNQPTANAQLIAGNFYLELREDAETGERKLFGKCGYTQPTPKTDRYTLANLAAIERAMSAGELTDVNGEVATDGAVIQVFCRVTRIKPADQMEQVGSIRTLSGDAVTVPDAPAAPVAGTPDWA